MATDAHTSGFVARHRFVLLFATLLVFFVLVPISQHLHAVLSPGAPPVLEALMFILLLAGTVVSVSGGRSWKLASILLAFPTAVLSVVHGFSRSSPIGAARHLVGIVFLSYAIVVMMRFIFSKQRVTANTICASLCIYLLFGIVWALAYSTIELFDPEAFRSTLPGTEPFPQFGIGSRQPILALYFSFCSLTTLGYGDIVPVSPTTRALATLEAITGQLYLAVLVARLVGLHIAHSIESDQKLA